jgi:aldehyde dehydrogenase (NAD+)
MQRQNHRGQPDNVNEEVLERHHEAKKVLEDKYKLYIGGQWIEAQDGKIMESVDAITGETLAEYHQGTATDIDRAVDAAEEALESEWGKLSDSERAEYLEEAADRLEERRNVLAIADSLEIGLPQVSAPGIVQIAIDQLRYFAAIAKTAEKGYQPTAKDFTGNMDKNHHIYTHDEPYGVVGLITAWNFPIVYTGIKLAPALAAGNAVVLKPSPRAVLSAFETMRVFDEVLPDGTVNLVPGEGNTVGEAISNHPKIRKVSLTGSTNAGRSVMQAAASNIKSVSLELGGKSPHIIFPDANLDSAATGVSIGIFHGAGQFCTAGSRLFLHEDVYDEFLQILKETTEQMFGMGDPLDDETRLGPLVDHKHLDRVQSYVETAVDNGAQVYMGGGKPDYQGLGDAAFFEPTILTNVDNDDTVACEEVFGPVLSVLKWNDRDEMIHQANDTEYGLSSGLWTEDLKTAHNVAEELEAGTVWVNCYNKMATGVPHGGYKQSGLGHEMGREAFNEYRQSKVVNIDLTEDHS